MNLIGSNVVWPCAIVNTTSAESNAVLPGVRGRSGLTMFMLAKVLIALDQAEDGGKLAQVSLGDVGLAAAVEVPDVAALAVDLELGVDVAAVGLPCPRWCGRIPRAGRPGAPVPRDSAAWRRG